ncbi:GntR family transcriptional regulator [Sneathiella chinensis]|uniref:GntR family transcriptional regulator n=1 Tax=Sneathiella chinensis TaxID=349750 RepID=A0ABQ5TZE0_9PROT|nr:GntR family transcriptional regulator [Sneathiella chinensis]GLQ04858.1 GntR family transcriptional regulator [Sneathiella chinensis]
MRSSDSAYTSRVSLYLKVANVIRSRIVKGIWKVGERLPNITRLCDEFKVGRITVRQALNLLSEEGLIQSTRGRGTFVTSVLPKDSPLTDPPDQQNADTLFEGLRVPANSIRIIEVAEPAPLPPYLAGPYNPFPDYVRIRKLRCHNDIPYCLMDVYVALQIYDRFPDGMLEREAVAKLVSRHSQEAVADANQSLTVGVADYETARILQCDLSAPVAEMDRYFLSRDDAILSRGHYLYRGDMFRMETHYSGDPLVDFPSGWLPGVKEE